MPGKGGAQQFLEGWNPITFVTCEPMRPHDNPFWEKSNRIGRERKNIVKSGFFQVVSRVENQKFIIIKSSKNQEFSPDETG